ncbi:hypothetical protein VQ045_19105, partial [Aurantimonas sp. E1-2-R+4]
SPPSAKGTKAITGGVLLRPTARYPAASVVDFCTGALTDPIARIVKLADLADNSDRSRLGEITDEDERRLAKYARAREILLEEE